jgi:hypothetical protein
MKKKAINFGDVDGLPQTFGVCSCKPSGRALPRACDALGRARPDGGGRRVAAAEAGLDGSGWTLFGKHF